MVNRVRLLKWCMLLSFTAFFIWIVLQASVLLDTGSLTYPGEPSRGEGQSHGRVWGNGSLDAIRHIQKLLWRPTNNGMNTTSVERTYISMSVKGLLSEIDTLLKLKEGGYFVMINTKNSDTPTLVQLLEEQQHWDGLVIEQDTSKYTTLQQTHRRSRLLNACIKTDPDASRTGVPCFLVSEILQAIGRMTIDILMISVREERDRLILKTVPFGQVIIHAIIMKYNGTQPKDYDDFSSAFLAKHGYTSINLSVDHPTNTAYVTYVSKLIVNSANI